MRSHRPTRTPARLAALGLALALCLPLAGCGEALGSRPVVVSDDPPAYSNGSSSQPGGSAPASGPAALLAEAETTEAGTMYLDLTEEMYATGRYGEKPDGEGCISAARAADLAAQYAGAFVDYGTENEVWTLQLQLEDAAGPTQPSWVCLLSLPKWSQDPQAVLSDPTLQALTQEELLQLGDVCRLRFYINAVTGQFSKGECDLPSDMLESLTLLAGYEPEKLQPYAARRCFSAVAGAEPQQIERYADNALFCDFIVHTANGEQYALVLRHETGLLKRFYRLTDEHFAAAGIQKGASS